MCIECCARELGQVFFIKTPIHGKEKERVGEEGGERGGERGREAESGEGEKLGFLGDPLGKAPRTLRIFGNQESVLTGAR